MSDAPDFSLNVHLDEQHRLQATENASNSGALTLKFSEEGYPDITIFCGSPKLATDLCTAINAICSKHYGSDPLTQDDSVNLPEEGDWIEWHGGEQPVPDCVPVDIVWTDGTVFYSQAPEAWDFIHRGHRSDIVRYRVTKLQQIAAE